MLCTSDHGANMTVFRMCLPELCFHHYCKVFEFCLGKAPGITHQPSFQIGQGFLSLEIVTANLHSNSCFIKGTLPKNSTARRHIQMAPFQGLY